MLVFPRSKETSRSNFLLHDPVEPSHKPCDLVGLDYIPTDLQKTGPPGQSTHSSAVSLPRGAQVCVTFRLDPSSSHGKLAN